MRMTHDGRTGGTKMKGIISVLQKIRKDPVGPDRCIHESS